VPPEDSCEQSFHPSASLEQLVVNQAVPLLTCCKAIPENINGVSQSRRNHGVCNSRYDRKNQNRFSRRAAHPRMPREILRVSGITDSKNVEQNSQQKDDPMPRRAGQRLEEGSRLNFPIGSAQRFQERHLEKTADFVPDLWDCVV